LIPGRARYRLSSRTFISVSINAISSSKEGNKIGCSLSAALALSRNINAAELRLADALIMACLIGISGLGCKSKAERS